MTASHAVNLILVLLAFHAKRNAPMEHFQIRRQVFVRDATQHARHVQELVQTIAYHVQKIWYKVKAKECATQFAPKDNFQKKENVRSVIQVADLAMAQIALTVSTAPMAKHSTILLVLIAVLMEHFLLTNMVFISVNHVIQSVILVMVPLRITVSYVRAHFSLNVECALYSVHPNIQLMNKHDLVTHVEKNVNHHLEKGIDQCSTQMIVR